MKKVNYNSGFDAKQNKTTPWYSRTNLNHGMFSLNPIKESKLMTEREVKNAVENDGKFIKRYPGFSCYYKRTKNIMDDIRAHYTNQDITWRHLRCVQPIGSLQTPTDESSLYSRPLFSSSLPRWTNNDNYIDGQRRPCGPMSFQEGSHLRAPEPIKIILYGVNERICSERRHERIVQSSRRHSP